MANEQPPLDYDALLVDLHALSASLTDLETYLRGGEKPKLVLVVAEDEGDDA